MAAEAQVEARVRLPLANRFAPYSTALSTARRPERTFQPLRGAIAATGRWFDRVFGPAWRWVDHHLFHPVGRWFTTDIGLSWPVVVLAIALVVGIRHWSDRDASEAADRLRGVRW